VRITGASFINRFFGDGLTTRAGFEDGPSGVGVVVGFMMSVELHFLVVYVDILIRLQASFSGTADLGLPFEHATDDFLKRFGLITGGDLQPGRSRILWKLRNVVRHGTPCPFFGNHPGLAEATLRSCTCSGNGVDIPVIRVQTREHVGCAT